MIRTDVFGIWIWRIRYHKEGVLFHRSVIFLKPKYFWCRKIVILFNICSQEPKYMQNFNFCNRWPRHNMTKCPAVSEYFDVCTQKNWSKQFVFAHVEFRGSPAYPFFPMSLKLADKKRDKKFQKPWTVTYQFRKRLLDHKKK